MSSSTNMKTMVPNTKASRRSGAYKYGQKIVKKIQNHDDNNNKKKRQDKPKDRKIYSVQTVSKYGNVNNFTVWEENDWKMNRHFGNADKNGKNYFSIKDIRGKTITNVDLRKGWEYKKTLRWNPNIMASDGSSGGWQDIKQWHRERKNNIENNKTNVDNLELNTSKETDLFAYDEKGFPDLS